MGGIPAEIRSKHLSKTSSELYLCAILLDKIIK
jgi:hypothetical protein